MKVSMSRRRRKYLEWNSEQWRLHGKSLLRLMNRVEKLEAEASG